MTIKSSLIDKLSRLG